MALSVVAQGNATNLLAGVRAVGQQFAAGDRGQFRLRLRWVPPGFIGTVQKALELGGVHLTSSITSAANVLRIPFRVNLGPLAIAFILVAVVLALLLSWQLLKEIPEAAEDLTKLALMVGAILIGLALLSPSRRRSRDGPQ